MVCTINRGLATSLEALKAIASMPLVIALVPLKCSPVAFYDFLIGFLLPRSKCLGALPLSEMKHTGLHAIAVVLLTSVSFYGHDFCLA